MVMDASDLNLFNSTSSEFVPQSHIEKTEEQFPSLELLESEHTLKKPKKKPLLKSFATSRHRLLLTIVLLLELALLVDSSVLLDNGSATLQLRMM